MVYEMETLVGYAAYRMSNIGRDASKTVVQVSSESDRLHAADSGILGNVTSRLKLYVFL